MPVTCMMPVMEMALARMSECSEDASGASADHGTRTGSNVAVGAAIASASSMCR